MLAVIRILFSLINAILRIVATTIVAGGSILVAVLLLVLVVAAIAALSGVGTLGLVRRRRHK